MLPKRNYQLCPVLSDSAGWMVGFGSTQEICCPSGTYGVPILGGHLDYFSSMPTAEAGTLPNS
jgi:hypothetical protein